MPVLVVCRSGYRFHQGSAAFAGCVLELNLSHRGMVKSDLFISCHLRFMTTLLLSLLPSLLVVLSSLANTLQDLLPILVGLQLGDDNLAG